MSRWIPFLYLAAAGVGLRVLFALLGRWLEPNRAERSSDRLSAPSADLPPRPPLGDYRGE